VSCESPFVSFVGGALLLLSSLAYATSGNEYRALGEADQLAWTVGVLDGILTAQLFESNKKPPLADCLGNLEREQIRAI
jgi:hypothetical protein